MKVSNFIKEKKLPYAELGYVSYFFYDLYFLKNNKYIKIISKLVHITSMINPNYSHEDILNFLNSTEVQDKWMNTNDTLTIEYKKESYSEFIKSIRNDKVIKYLTKRLNYLIQLPEAPKVFSEKHYTLMQYIQDSEIYFIPIRHNSDWEYLYVEDKYSIIGRLLGQEWEFNFICSGLNDDTYSIEIEFKNPISKKFKTMEIYLSVNDFIKISKDKLVSEDIGEDMWKYLKRRSNKRIIDFKKEKPNIKKLNILSKNYIF